MKHDEEARALGKLWSRLKVFPKETRANMLRYLMDRSDATEDAAPATANQTQGDGL